MSFWRKFRHWLHRQLSNDNFRCRQWRKFSQNAIFVSVTTTLHTQKYIFRSINHEVAKARLSTFCTCKLYRNSNSFQMRASAALTAQKAWSLFQQILATWAFGSLSEPNYLINHHGRGLALYLRVYIVPATVYGGENAVSSGRNFAYVASCLHNWSICLEGHLTWPRPQLEWT